MFDLFALTGRGPATLRNGFVSIFVTDLGASLSFEPLLSWGDPIDFVTGAAHCVLAPYWAPRVGRLELVGEQASARGGVVRMRLDGDRVVLGGQATTVWRGEPLAESPAG